MNALILFLSLLIGQDPTPPLPLEALPVPPGSVSVDPIPEPRQRTYADALAEAKERKMPLVVFVSIPSRVMSDAVTISLSSFDGERNAIVVTTDWQEAYWLKSTATEAEIRRRMEVRSLVASFRPIQQWQQECST